MKISKFKFILSLIILLLGLLFVPQNASADTIYLRPYVAITSYNGSLPLVGVEYNMPTRKSSFDTIMHADNTEYTLYDSNGDVAGSNAMYVVQPILKNALTYDTATKKLNFNYTVSGTPSTSLSSDLGLVYLGICPSGYHIGNLTITKTASSTTYAGSWTFPELSADSTNKIYQNTPGIFITHKLTYITGGISYKIWQFDSTPILTQNLSYASPITVVNGKAFSITLPNTNGKFVGTKYVYGGSITGTASGSDTILAGTLYSAPSSFADLTIGSDIIKIRAVAPPSTSTATISFY